MNSESESECRITTEYDVYTMDPEDGKSTHKGLSAPEEIATNGAIHVHATAAAASSGSHK